MNIVLVMAATVFEAAFDKGLPGWEVVNGSTAIEAETLAGERAVVVRHSPEKPSAGTNWELTGAPFAVTPGSRLSVLVRAQTTLEDLRFCHGYFGRYITGLYWFGADGKRLPVSWGFGYDTKPGEWAWTVAGTEVPAGAATARLALGMDAPNLGSNDWFAVSAARVVAGDRRPAAERITLRDDGLSLVGGKPFFPIGIYAVSKCDFNSNSFEKAFADLRDAGFNLVHCGRVDRPEEKEEFLSVADKMGLKVWAMPVPDFNSDFVKESQVAAKKKHPSVLAWYLADDTASHAGPETVAWRDRVVKALDPDRLTLQADGVLSGDANCRYDRFVHSTDVFLPEIYPAYTAEAHGDEVAIVIRDMKATRAAVRAAGSPAKSIWPIIQHFDGWGWKRFPTFDELRAMSWEGIVHGGNGIVWYVYHSKTGRGRGVISSPQRWDEITRVSREIAAVRDDLMTRSADVQPAVTVVSGPKTDALRFPSVSVLLKTGPAPLLVAVNSATNAVRARITVTGFRTAEALGEGRTLPSVGGILDDFSPYGVRLYRLVK